MATINKRGQSYTLQWSEGGKQHRVSLGRISQAEAIRAKANKEIQLGQSNETAPYFEYFAAEYLRHYEQHYPASFDRARGIVVNHLAPHFASYMLNQINGRLLRDYQLSRKGVKTGTYLKEFRTLKAMLNKAVEWEYINENPIKHIKPPALTDSKPPHFYSAAELAELYRVSSYRYQWQFMANTGIRLGEAMNLIIPEHVKASTIHVVSSSVARTKSGKWREIPLFDGAREALQHLGDRLFTINPKSVSRAFHKDAARAGLGGSLHSLRHTFISHLAMSGKFSMSEIQSWAGHASVITTQRYQHLIPNYRQIDTGALKL